jgi:tRNA (mo5U34)-methyltransferase
MAFRGKRGFARASGRESVREERAERAPYGSAFASPRGEFRVARCVRVRIAEKKRGGKMPEACLETPELKSGEKTRGAESEPLSVETLARVIGENARLQAELHQVFATHLLEVRNSLRAVQESVQRLDRRLAENSFLTALSPSVATPSGATGSPDGRLHLATAINSLPVSSASAQSRADLLRAEAQKIKWWHSIDLGDGIVTPGSYDTRTLLDRIALPQDLRGLSVLDIGAWDGYLSFAAERRGASRVLATDSYVWQNNVLSGKAGFQFARTALGSKVEDQNIDVMDLSPETVGTFDVVLFSGVLYHLQHPLLALQRLRKVTKKLLIMETHIDLPNIRRPAMAFYPGSEANNDPTNWWGPNEACCVEMLKTAGFRNIKLVGRLPAPPVSSPEQISYGRVAFHAVV